MRVGSVGTLLLLFTLTHAQPDGEPRDPLTEFLLVGATPGWRDVLPITVDPPSKANRWEPIPTWEELALLNDTFDRRAKDEIGAAVLYLYEEDYDALGENVTLHAVPRSLLRAGRHSRPPRCPSTVLRFPA